MPLQPHEELDVLRAELAMELRRLESLERAPREGRWTRSERAHVNACRRREDHIRVLRRLIATETTEERGEFHAEGLDERGIYGGRSYDSPETTEER